MPHRPGWIRGEHLVRDEQSDVVVYSGELVKTWDGLWIRKELAGDEIYRDPQDFVRAGGDPYPAREPVRPEVPASALEAIDLLRPDVDRVGQTVGGVQLPTGAAQHLFRVYGIDDMVIVDTTVQVDELATCAKAFFVRADG